LAVVNYYRGINPGVLGVATPKILGRAGRGVAGSRGDRGRVMKYYYRPILSCTGSMFESGDF